MTKWLHFIKLQYPACKSLSFPLRMWSCWATPSSKEWGLSYRSRGWPLAKNQPKTEALHFKNKKLHATNNHVIGKWMQKLSLAAGHFLACVRSSADVLRSYLHALSKSCYLVGTYPSFLCPGEEGGDKSEECIKGPRTNKQKKQRRQCSDRDSHSNGHLIVIKVALKSRKREVISKKWC